MLISNSNIEQAAQTIERFLKDHYFTLVISRQSPNLGRVEMSHGQYLRGEQIVCSPPMSGAYPRWLCIDTSIGPLVLPASHPRAQLEQMQTSQMFLQCSRLVLSSYGILSGRFLQWMFLLEPEAKFPVTQELPDYLVALSQV